MNKSVYAYPYNYEQMKVMTMLGKHPDTEDLDYEDLALIAILVETTWNERYQHQPQMDWADIRSHSEEGYIQAYADRTLGDFIKYYKETRK